MRGRMGQFRIAPSAIRAAPKKPSAKMILAAGALGLGLVLLVALNMSRRLAAALAAEALPSNQGGLDLAAAPRRALLVTLQIAILLLGGGPLVAVVQPFYPSLPGAAVLLILLALLAYPLWRSAANLQGHARAGAQVILEAVVSQGQAGSGHGQPEDQAERRALAVVPGLGSPALVRIEEASPALGRSLKQLGLRGRSGATVIAISRGEGQVVYPDADDLLRLGDVLVLTGTAESVELAKGILSQVARETADPQPPSPPPAPTPDTERG